MPRTQMIRLFARAWILTAVLVVNAKKRKMTVANSCPYTVWPGLFTSVGPKPVNTPTGWEAPPGTSWTFEVEESWGGRIWPRTDCDFTTDKPGALQCATGACNGGLECDPNTGTGVPPCSLAEFNLQEEVDHYDASNVDGFSIPIAISSNGDCPLANCPYDLLPKCPDSLKKKDESGKVIGCNTDCGANPQNEEYCCFGAHDTLATCPASGIPNHDFWLKACPISYVYAYGDALALFTCTKRVDWTITFCPGPGSFDTKVTFPDGKTTTQGAGFPEPTAVKITKTGVTAGDGKPVKTNPAKSGTSGSPSKTASSTPAEVPTPAPPGSASPTTPADGSPTPSDSPPVETPSESPSTGDNTIFGVESTYVYVAFGLLVLVIIGAAALFFMRQQKHRRRHRHEEASSDGDDSATDSDDADGRRHSSRKRDKYDSDDSSSSSNGDDRRSLGRFAALEKMERLAVQQSIYSAAAKNPAGLGGLAGGERTGRADPRPRFQLAKPRYMSGSSDSDSASGGWPSRGTPAPDNLI
ncbi:hypothetical protein C6P46_000052 [Rhodotorula mucilaginosa]|uniref:Osmotin, thaumatin-like protein n=1 Tax=Rhodotorula mucilaginosa TaxID=5537 RepID=A0A9P6WA46_RHOMI|nr:hypothetical protein C6P46_000052 [Rhodotorula mucilaginosa]TKA57349.1 hypothetical protein B0A53_00577 [Rhodotorula sp. CCFEE 5036]